MVTKREISEKKSSLMMTKWEISKMEVSLMDVCLALLLLGSSRLTPASTDS